MAASQKLLSKSDGPYEVEELPTPQNATLVDPLSKQRIDACKGGRTVAVDRLIYYPVAPTALEVVERGVEDEVLRALQRYDVVADEEAEVTFIVRRKIRIPLIEQNVLLFLLFLNLA